MSMHLSAHKDVSHPAGQVGEQIMVPLDFEWINHGSIVILTAITKAAESWVAVHLPEDCARWGQHGYAIEPRYFGDILAGLLDDGYSARMPAGW